ncbi:MAG: histidine kinase [Cyclobacteriaceae bacterium]|nr:histidine kinase [Cyclobacteriaceae bacterium]
MNLHIPSLRTFIKKNLRTLVGVVVAGFVMSWFIWRGCCQRVSAYFWISAFTGSIWVALWFGNAFVSQWLDNLFSWHQQPVKRLLAGLIGMTLYTIAAVLAIIYTFHYAFGFQLGDMMNGTFYSTIVITLIITMFMTGRSFLLNWRASAVEAERLKKENMEAQFNSLRSQVNPHFLFNSLNALTNLVYQDQDKAVKFIKQLSAVYRYVLSTRDKELVPLAEELEFLHAYLFLQQIRFGEKLKLQVDVNSDGLVAPLVLQMLVENAIKHNIIAEEQPLTIRIYKEEACLVVANNLQKRAIPTDESTGAGLENIKRRYGFLSSMAVRVEESTHTFKVIIPIIPN